MAYIAHIYGSGEPIESAVEVSNSGYTAWSTVQLAAGPTTFTVDVSHLSIDGMINTMRSFAQQSAALYNAEAHAAALNAQAGRVLGSMLGSPNGH